MKTVEQLKRVTHRGGKANASSHHLQGSREGGFMKYECAREPLSTDSRDTSGVCIRLVYATGL